MPNIINILAHVLIDKHTNEFHSHRLEMCWIQKTTPSPVKQARRGRDIDQE